MTSGLAEIEVVGSPVGTPTAERSGLIGGARRSLQRLRRPLQWIVSLGLVVGSIAMIVAASDGLVGEELSKQELANMTLARQAIAADLLTRGDLTFVDGVVAPNALLILEEQTWTGPEGMKQLVTWLNEQVPDRVVLAYSMEADGNRVTLDGRISGTLSPGFLDAISREGYGSVEAIISMEVINGQVTMLEIDPVLEWRLPSEDQAARM
jgi:hypothetical protein